MNKQWYIFILILLFQQNSLCFSWPFFSWFKGSFTNLWHSIAFISKSDLNNAKDELLNNTQITIDNLRLAALIKISELGKETNDQVDRVALNQKKLGKNINTFRDQLQKSQQRAERDHLDMSRSLLAHRYQLEEIEEKASLNQQQAVGLASSLENLTNKNSKIVTRIKDLDTKLQTNFHYLQDKFDKIDGIQTVIAQNQKENTNQLNNFSSKTDGIENSLDTLEQQISELTQLLKDNLSINKENSEAIKLIRIQLMQSLGKAPTQTKIEVPSSLSINQQNNNEQKYSLPTNKERHKVVQRVNMKYSTQG